MERKWTYYAVYSIIQIHFVRGIWEETINAGEAGENIYALPGSNVNLTCQTRKKAFLVQMQWSKVTNKMDLIALYHPQHGFYCASESSCESLVAFTESPGNVIKWTLHLRNVSSSLRGKYECSFTLYPEGTWTKIYDLLIQRNVTQDEWRSSHTIEIEINQTLEIPCFQNISSEISSSFTFAWLVEENGTQETLITQDHTISNSTLFKDRVKLGTDYGLYLSPVQIHDNDRKFCCHATVRPGKILRSTTMVKVFAKPEIPMIVENNSMDGLQERTFTCSLRNVFPTANLTWFLDGGLLQGEKEGEGKGEKKSKLEVYVKDLAPCQGTSSPGGLKVPGARTNTEKNSVIHITNEERKSKGGCLELKSVLTRLYINEPTQSNNLTIWCVAQSPGPGNKVWRISSEKIYFSLGSVNPPTDPPPNITESPFITQSSPANSRSSTRYTATSSISPVDVSTSTPNFILQTSNSSGTTQGFNYSWTTREKDTEQSVSWMPSETYGLSSSGADSTLHGTEVNKPKDGMSWPVIVAALLFLCVICFGLGLRKWCQYQKEIMERPPPFKPPPPPVKYTCFQEPTGSDLPCHELETL